MSGHDRVLACVEHVHKANRGFSPEFVRLVPVARWDGGWSVIEDVLEEFPGEGLIYWPRPKGQRFEDGQAWIVEVELRDSGEDHYWVRAGAKPTRPWEAVVVPGADDVVTLRRALAADRFPLSPTPAGLALVAHPTREGLWLAPFDAPRDRRGHEYGFSQGWSRLLRVDSAAFLDIMLGGVERRLLDPSANTAEPAGAFIVQPDEELVVGAARRLKRWDKDAFAALGMSQTVIEAHASQLARIVDQDTTGQDAARDEALVALLAADTLAADAAHRLAETVARHPVVAAEIETRVLTGIAERRAELEAELEARRTQLEAASSVALAVDEARLATLAEERECVESAIATLEQEFQRAVDRQIAEGMPGLADHLVTRVLLHSQGQTLAPSGLRQRTDTPSDPEPSGAELLTSAKAVRTAIMARTAYEKVDSLLGVVAAGLLLGRRALFVTGSAAAALAVSVAATLAGRRVLHVAMSPTVFALGDLLALPVSSEGTAMALGAALTHAADREEPVALVVHGANRAPLEGAFADLLDILGPHGGGLRGWRDPSGRDAVARLDARLLVVATLARGPTAFSIPRDLASRVPLLDADRSLLSEAAAPANVPPVTAIAPEFFDDLAAMSGASEEIARWKSAMPMTDRAAVFERFLAIAREIIPAPLADSEILAALSLGRGDFDAALVTKLGAAWSDGFDPQEQHRRLAGLFDKGDER